MKKAALIILLLVFSCKSQKQHVEIDKRLNLLVQDGYFPIENPEIQIIKDSKSLRTFFSRVNQTRKPGLPIPEVDFNTHSVLAACMGAVDTNALPIMYLKSESAEEMVISVQLPNKNKDLDVQSFPFCVYAIFDEGKKLSVEME
ncbi:MAG: hypothetical protein AAF039_12145 [Bacteroidota bacterium]